MYFHNFCNYLPLENNWPTWINLKPLHQIYRTLCANLIEIDPVVMEKMKMRKVYDNNDDDNDDDNDNNDGDGQRTISFIFGLEIRLV